MLVGLMSSSDACGARVGLGGDFSPVTNTCIYYCCSWRAAQPALLLFRLLASVGFSARTQRKQPKLANWRAAKFCQLRNLCKHMENVNQLLSSIVLDADGSRNLLFQLSPFLVAQADPVEPKLDLTTLDQSNWPLRPGGRGASPHQVFARFRLARSLILPESVTSSSLLVN